MTTPLHTRRRTLATTLLVAAAVAPSLAVATTGAASAAPTSVPAAAPTTGVASPTSSLLQIFGPDWRPGAIDGEIVLGAGTPSTAGLPAGYAAAVRTFGVGAREGTLQSFCTPMREKGTVFGPCTLLTTSSVLVLEQHIRPAADLPRTFTTLRLFRPRADGGFQCAELALTRRASAKPEQVAAAEAWAQDLVPRLTRAVRLTTPTG